MLTLLQRADPFALLTGFCDFVMYFTIFMQTVKKKVQFHEPQLTLTILKIFPDSGKLDDVEDW